MANSNMDPFDEFEFKPLTDGLGFHKKSVSLKEGLKASGVLQEEMQSIPVSVPKELLEESIPMKKKHSFEDVLSALEKTPIGKSAAPSGLNFTETLPREPKKAMETELPTPGPVQSPFPMPSAYRNPVVPAMPVVPGKRAAVSQVGQRRGAANSPKRRLIPATMSVPSAVLDLVIVFALSLIFLVALLTVTKVDLNVVANNLMADAMTQISLFVLFIAVMQMYVVIARSFFGRTIGEWTFDLQVGLDDEQSRESYPLKVTLRSFLNTATGLILLPLVSAVLGRDIAGQLSGIKLYRQRS